jgi:SagB-type dehydrogenase family enzyme
MAHPGDPIRLPQPRFSGPTSLEDALLARRSIRHIARDPLTVDELTQLLWAAQGVTHAQGFRTAPSAGALFPLELHVAAGCVTGLRAGLYRYRPLEHALVASAQQDLRAELCRAALSQRPVERAPVVFLLTAVYGRATQKYGERGVRYADMEAGHAAQNLILQAAALELRAVVVGAFEDDAVRRVALLPPGEEPLYLVPVGR